MTFAQSCSIACFLRTSLVAFPFVSCWFFGSILLTFLTHLVNESITVFWSQISRNGSVHPLSFLVIVLKTELTLNYGHFPDRLQHDVIPYCLRRMGALEQNLCRYDSINNVFYLYPLYLSVRVCWVTYKSDNKLEVVPELTVQAFSQALQ